MKIKFLVFFLHLSIIGFSQKQVEIFANTNKSELPTKTKYTPEWANFFYKENAKVNVYELEKKVAVWFEQNEKEYLLNPNKKNQDTLNNYRKSKGCNWYQKPYVRFYKEWRRNIPNNWITPDGTLTLPTKEVFYQKIKETEHLVRKNKEE